MFNPYQNAYQNPYQNTFNPMYNGINKDIQTLVRVNGIEGAKAYQMGANSQVALFDANDDLMYIKCTDGAGFPSIRTFKFEELHNFSKNQENIAENKQYVTRKELEEYVKQFVQSATNTTESSSEIQQTTD